MGQTTEVRNSANARMMVSASNLGVGVPGALTTILEILSLTGIKRLWVELKPTIHPFTAFQVQAKFHPAGDYVVIASATGDYTVPKGIIFGASGDLTILAAGGTGWLAIDVTGLVGVRLQANGLAGTLVDVYAGASS